MRIAVIVPNFNGAHFLRACLTALQNSAPTAHEVEITVIDNGSSDGSAELLGQEFPLVRCIVNPQNLGFTRAINQGAAATEAEWLLLLNNDAIVAPGALSELIYALASADAAVAGVQPLLLNAADPARIDSLGIALDRRLRARDDRHGMPAALAPRDAREIFGACAACVLLRRDVFLRAGGFDPDFFAEWDDVDFSMRVRWLGYRFLLIPAAVVHHYRSPTSNRDNSAKVLRHRRNQVLTMMKSLPRGLRWRGIAYRILRDLSMLPHYVKRHDLNGMFGVWRECLLLRGMMRGRRATFLREATLSHAEMRRQLRRFMNAGSAP